MCSSDLCFRRSTWQMTCTKHWQMASSVSVSTSSRTHQLAQTTTTKWRTKTHVRCIRFKNPCEHFKSKWQRWRMRHNPHALQSMKPSTIFKSLSEKHCALLGHVMEIIRFLGLMQPSRVLLNTQSSKRMCTVVHCRVLVLSVLFGTSFFLWGVVYFKLEG